MRRTWTQLPGWTMSNAGRVAAMDYGVAVGENGRGNRVVADSAGVVCECGVNYKRFRAGLSSFAKIEPEKSSFDKLKMTFSISRPGVKIA